MWGREISAPASEFLMGLQQTQGYHVEADGERVSVTFERWSLDQVNPFEMPCLRLPFRRVETRIVLERFTIDDAGDGEQRLVDLEALRDALQAWMDSMAG
jgi:hypothetical protein